MVRKLKELQKRLGYNFKKRDLLIQALTHPSFGFPHNERLEFLGDSILGACISHLLFEAFPQAKEGELSKRRAHLVKEKTLCEISHRLGLFEFLRLGKGEELDGGRRKPSVLASAFEALIGAVYLDGGLEEALRITRSLFEDYLKEPFLEDGDYKTQLQELSQALFKEMPVYRILSEKGPDHQKIFEAVVLIKGHIWGKGEGRTKKEAEQRAAKEALIKLNEKGNPHLHT
jgi:ribonuclease-3